VFADRQSFHWTVTEMADSFGDFIVWSLRRIIKGR